MPTDLNIDFAPFNISSSDPEKWIAINENTDNLDCFGITDGSAFCDECRAGPRSVAYPGFSGRCNRTTMTPET